MASDWRRPRAGPDARTPDHPAAFPTLPSVAELLSSSRPHSHNLHNHHHPTTPFVASTPPTLSIPHAVSASTASASSSSAASWSPANPASPPISPTEFRPARTFQDPSFRRQHASKSATPRDSPLPFSSSRQPAHDYPQRPINEARQDSAIFYKPIETCNDAHPQSTTFSYSHQSPKDSHHPPSPRSDVHQANCTFYPSRPHSNSAPSGVHPSADLSRSHGYFAERPAPVDARSGSDSSVKTPDTSNNFNTNGNSNGNGSTTNGTRNHRYNVRFAVNYTSDNMPSSQKARTDPPNTAPVPSPPSERQTTPPEPLVVATKEPPAPSTNNLAIQEDSQPSARPRDRESSVERCQGCNEPWRRPLPNLDSVRQSSPAESMTQLMKISQDFVESLRDQKKKADAAHEDWRWRHSHCVKPPSDDHAVGPVSPAATEPSDASNNTRTEVVSHVEQPADRNPNKRKPENTPGDDEQMPPKMRKVAVEPAPAVRPPAP